jgi:putative serine protease PepD
VSPSVVAIEVRTSQGAAAGSGVVISADGLIVTNAHVVADATAITIRDGSGQTHGADLVGSSPKNDIALVRQRDAKDLKPATLGTSGALHVGDEVVAIGNAYDLGDSPTVTKGIISAKGRTLDTGEVKLENLLQTDAAINHGNSGGPLLNLAGEVIGINSAGIPNANNLGFAIEIDAVKPLIEKLRTGQGDVKTTAFLGVATIAAAELDAATRSRLGVTATTGAVITSVTAGSAAKDGGLKEGDVIVAIDTHAVTGPPEIRDVLAAKKPGEPVSLDIDRRSDRLTIVITLGSRVVSNA